MKQCAENIFEIVNFRSSRNKADYSQEIVKKKEEYN